MLLFDSAPTPLNAVTVALPAGRPLPTVERAVAVETYNCPPKTNTPRALVVSASGVNRVYDGTTQATVQLSERPLGVFSRQLFLGDSLDTDHIDAAYNNGVLILRIPIAEKAKPRKIAVAGSQSGGQQAITG